ncbi:MAG: hypothetical protein R8N23_20070 [Reichenbachiella sp.]|uniref:hypothetical protein n=1 Tax=Reichenbachiella sp. TaxID=2184521 RepID=UPI002966B412|nr:hypothetical protein [Reichenbachiella sp.]MDW3212177.1 hypothetical protein [Reichenbachiella sp.]
MNNSMEDILNSLGFGSPSTEKELSNFRKFYSDYEFKSNPNCIDPEKIWESIHAPKITGKDYHKRTVLAAEIVFQLHEEWSLGHLKLQKLIYLCQNSIGMALHTQFLKQAMGPYDPKLMRSIDSQFLKNKWFNFNKYSKQKYLPLENVGGHKEWYERYFSDELEDIQMLIDLFRKMKTYQIELIATLYDCWKETLKEKHQFDSETIISKFYAWSEEKQKFTADQINNAINWMRDNRIYPITDN